MTIATLLSTVTFSKVPDPARKGEYIEPNMGCTIAMITRSVQFEA